MIENKLNTIPDDFCVFLFANNEFENEQYRVFMNIIWCYRSDDDMIVQVEVQYQTNLRSTADDGAIGLRSLRSRGTGA